MNKPTVIGDRTIALQNRPMLYLAAPYSDPDPGVRQRRFEAVCEQAAALIRAGALVFSPLSHSHPIAIYGVPTDWSYWDTFDSQMLAACDELVVLMLPGWRESVGVQAEIDLALELDLPIRYLEPTTHTLVHVPADANA